MRARLQREAYNLIEYTLQLTQALSENKQGWRNKWHGITMSKHTMTHHNKLRTRTTTPRLDSWMRKLMSMPRWVQRSIWRLNMRCPTYSQVTTGQPLRCRWCDEDYNSITEHWLWYIGKNWWRPDSMNTMLSWTTEKQQLQYSINRTPTKRSQYFYEHFLFLSQIRKHN